MSHASVFLSMRLRHLRQTKVTTTRYHRVLGHSDRIFDTFAYYALRVTHLSSFRSKKAQQWRRKLGRAVEREWDSRSGGLRNSRQVKCDFVTYIIIKC